MSEESNANNNYGTQNALAVKNVGDVEYARYRNSLLFSDFGRESFLKFNLNSVTTPIKTAQLILKIQTGSAALSFDVAVVSNDGWNEGTINWNNKPATGATSGHVGNSGTATLNVANLNSVLGDKILTLRLFDSLSQNALMNVYSKEGGASVQPILRITV
jgi:hypothetical protein